jgi:BatD DUF11 like domain
MKRAALIICVIILFPLQAMASGVQAFVDRSRATLSETIHLTVSVDGGEGSVDVSPIKDFQVLSEGTSSSVQIINSRISRKSSHDYTLIPLKQGRLRIPPLTVFVKGKPFQTQEIVVTVTKSPQKQTALSDIFVRGSVSNKNPYVGQQIAYTFRLYHLVRIENAKIVQEPSFSGFTAKQIDRNKTFQTVINGREFEVTEVTYILTPTASGPQTIEPAILSLDVVQNRQRQSANPFDSFFNNSFFNDPFFGNTTLKPATLQTDPVSLNIQPLPPDASPGPFSGLVGRFSLHGRLEKNTINAGDSTTLSITVDGTGNIMDAASPAVKLPESFKVYPDNPARDIHISAEGYSGKKVFRYALVPVKKGDFSISPVRLKYFDTASRQYITLSTTPFSLKVLPSKEGNKLEMYSAQAKPLQLQKSFKKKVAFIGHDILPIKDSADVLNSRRSLSLVRFLLYLGMPVLLFFGVKLALTFFIKSDDPATVMARKAQDSLKIADGSPPDEIFLTALYRSLIYAIFSTARCKGESLTYAEAEKLLASNGTRPDISAEAVTLLNQIESARYGGMNLGNNEKKELFSRTQKVVRRLC